MAPPAVLGIGRSHGMWGVSPIDVLDRSIAVLHRSLHIRSMTCILRI